MRLSSLYAFRLLFTAFLIFPLLSNAQSITANYFNKRQGFEKEIEAFEQKEQYQQALGSYEKLIAFVLQHDGEQAPDYSWIIEKLIEEDYFDQCKKAAFYRSEAKRLELADEKFSEVYRPKNERIQQLREAGNASELLKAYRDFIAFLLKEKPKGIYAMHEMAGLVKEEQINELAKLALLDDLLSTQLPFPKVSVHQMDDYAELCIEMSDRFRMLGMAKKGKQYLEYGIKAYENSLLGKNHPEYKPLVESYEEMKTIDFGMALMQKDYDAALAQYKDNPEVITFGDSASPFKNEVVQAGIKRSLKQGSIDQKMPEDYFVSGYAHKIDSLFYLQPTAKGHAEAEAMIRKSIASIDANLFNYYPEKYQEFIMQQYRINFESNLSFIVKSIAEKPELAALAYDQALRTNSLLINQQQWIRQRILLSSKTEVRQAYQDWNKQRVYLNSLYAKTPQELDKMKVSLLQAEEKCEELEENLHKLANASIPASTPATWQAVQEKLGAKEAAVEIVRFFFYDKGQWSRTPYYAVLIVKKNSKFPEFVLLTNGDLLENKWFLEYRKGLLDGGIRPLSYEHYWQPIQKNLDGIDGLYIATEGVYHQINLQTLPLPSQSGQYLLDKLHLTLLNSTRQLTQGVLKTTPAGKYALLVGNPLFEWQEYPQVAGKPASVNLRSGSFAFDSRSPEWDPLPGTEKEVQQIDKLLNQHNFKTKLLLGKEATESMIKRQSNPSIVHIATHGYFLPVDYSSLTKWSGSKSDVGQYPTFESRTLGTFTQAAPPGSSMPEEESDLNDFMLDLDSILLTLEKFNPSLNSGLVLSGAATYARLPEKPDVDDGILSAYEVNGLNLVNTELVVLSACETGLGQAHNGDGVYGLQRAFTVAGARCLISSLWKVNDYVTQELMNNFYVNWISNKMTKQEAFRQAQLQLRRNYAEPFYWGAFVMIGQ